ncbi:MAG: hypothetical protein RBS68_12085 [Anaerolineales bacterium]|jgi:hypothetical protein|nr:hypothetical protein [Anaerolineales bacterium]
MLFLLTLHSIIRWLVILVAIAAVIKLAIGLLQKQEYDKLTGGLVSAFSGLMDTQLLLGLIFFLWNGMAGAGYPRQRWEHLLIMLVAAVVAHLPSIWKKAETQKRLRNSLAAVLGALLLVLVGVSLLQPNRWLVIFGIGGISVEPLSVYEIIFISAFIHSVIFAFICGSVSSSKGRFYGEGFALGFFLGIIGLLT